MRGTTDETSKHFCPTAGKDSSIAVRGLHDHPVFSAAMWVTLPVPSRTGFGEFRVAGFEGKEVIEMCGEWRGL